MDALKYFKALADESRLRLINILRHHELRVAELVAVLNMGQSRISRHLKILGEAGLVDSWKDGVWGLYFAVKDGPGRRFLDVIGYLFENNDLFRKDLAGAAVVVSERKISNQQFFNRLADQWDLLKLEILGDFDLNRIILKDVTHCGVAVDLGCGTGDLLARMTTCADRVIGVDSAPGMLAEARKRFHNSDRRVEIRLGEIEHLPLSDREADLVVISLVLQYLTRPEAAVAEVSRVIKPGGTFIVADFKTHTQTMLRDKYGARRLGFDAEEVQSWLTAGGFDLIKVDRCPLNQDLVLQIFQARRRESPASAGFVNADNR